MPKFKRLSIRKEIDSRKGECSPFVKSIPILESRRPGGCGRTRKESLSDTGASKISAQMERNCTKNETGATVPWPERGNAECKLESPGKPGATMGPKAPPSIIKYPAPAHTASSLRDTMITAPSNLQSGTAGGNADRDEYLMRLLAKGAAHKPMQHYAAASLPTSSGFRVPEPVPPRGPTGAPATSLQPSQLRTGTTGTVTGTHLKPAVPKATAVPPTQQPCTETTPATVGTGGTGQSVQPPPRPGAQAEPSTAWSYAQTERRMGADVAASLRSAAVAHQVSFLEQLYDMHRAIAVQKLLVRTCPEVEHLMAEAMRLLQSSCSHHDAARGLDPPAKRHCGDARRALHPDSQFAALPLPGETVTATGDGSGDDGDGSGGNGSGGNGSGGGSTSPQPQVPLIPPPFAALQAAPSGASQTPLAFPRPHMPSGLPWGAGPMAAPPACVGGVPSGAGYPSAPGMPPYPPSNMAMMPAADPMTWWYQNYYGPAAMGGYQQPQLAAMAPAAAPSGAKWWQDLHQTFGPPADPEAVAAAAAAAGRKAAQLGDEGTAAVEVESARRGGTARNPGARCGSGAPSAGATKRVASHSQGNRRSIPVPPQPTHPRPRRTKRKPADPIEEASSGTTGQDHHHSPAVADDVAHLGKSVQSMSPRGSHPVTDKNAAKLLLAIREESKGGF